MNLKNSHRVVSFFEGMHSRISAFINVDFKLWLAGGAIRDILIGNDPKDLDFYTDLDATTIKKFIEFDTRKGNNNPPELKEKDEMYCVHPLIGEIHIREDDPPHNVFVAQIMSLADTPELQFSQELVNSFDWDISKFCFNGDYLILGQFPTKNTRLVLGNRDNKTGARSSLNRAIKFAARYEMFVDDVDLKYLFDKSVEQEKVKILKNLKNPK
jgi:hypothetical protein